MIWSWAEISTEQVASPAVHWAEMIDCSHREGLPELGPGRVRAVCATPDRTETARQGSARSAHDARSEDFRSQIGRVTGAREGGDIRGSCLTGRKADPRRHLGLGFAEMPPSPVLLSLGQWRHLGLGFAEMPPSTVLVSLGQ